jgi:hypothetical protein
VSNAAAAAVVHCFENCWQSHVQNDRSCLIVAIFESEREKEREREREREGGRERVKSVTNRRSELEEERKQMKDDRTKGWQVSALHRMPLCL